MVYLIVNYSGPENNSEDRFHARLLRLETQ